MSLRPTRDEVLQVYGPKYPYINSEGSINLADGTQVHSVSVFYSEHEMDSIEVFKRPKFDPTVAIGYLHRLSIEQAEEYLKGLQLAISIAKEL